MTNDPSANATVNVIALVTVIASVSENESARRKGTKAKKAKLSNVPLQGQGAAAGSPTEGENLPGEVIANAVAADRRHATAHCEDVAAAAVRLASIDMCREVAVAALAVGTAIVSGIGTFDVTGAATATGTETEKGNLIGTCRGAIGTMPTDPGVESGVAVASVGGRGVETATAREIGVAIKLTALASAILGHQKGFADECSHWLCALLCLCAASSTNRSSTSGFVCTR